MQHAKPLLLTEVRRILPTAAGVPMEFSLYTAAVAAAAVNGEYFCFYFSCYYSLRDNIFILFCSFF